MRIPPHLQERLRSARLSDLASLWLELNSSTEITGSPTPQKHVRQHASRAAKWIAVALNPDLGERGKRPSPESVRAMQEGVLLSVVAALDPQEVGQRARAAYLVTFLGIASEKAHESTETLGLGKHRRRINNISESVRRCLRFLGTLYSREGAQDSLWPPAKGGGDLAAGFRFYRQIRDLHIVRKILDPRSFRLDYVREAAASASGRFLEVRKAGDYNKMLRELRQLLSSGRLAPLGSDFVEGLSELAMNPDRGKTQAFSDADLISRWPKHFLPERGTPTRVDRQRGLPGFFSKQAGLERPVNHEGQTCRRQNRLGHHAVEGRLGALKRYLFRVVAHFAEDATRELSACFATEALVWWLPSYLAERDVITAMHRDELLEVSTTARVFFGTDIAEVQRLAEEIDFPQIGESIRGSEVLRLAKTPQVLLDWADAFRSYADAAPKPTIDRPSGLYFPRKCLEIDSLLRPDTGLRPENLESLEVRETAPGPGYPRPCIWWDAFAGVYRIRIPRSCMKQHKRTYASTNAATGGRGARRAYDFVIWRQRTIAATHEYLGFWKIARGVASGQTTMLYLNREGMAYTRGGFGNSFMAKKHLVVREWRKTTGVELPMLDRYAHRHLMGEFLGRHIPGGNLKSWYLTHHSDTGTDRNYGDDDALLLRECIDEILAGKPPRPAQEIQRWDHQDGRLDEMVKQMEELSKQLQVTNEALMKANAIIAEKDGLIARLSQRRR